MPTLPKNSQLDEFLDSYLPMVAERERHLFDEWASPFQQRLVVFGAGGLGRKIVAGLARRGIVPLALTDNNQTLWSTSVDGIPLLSPADAAARFGRSAAFVIAAWPAGVGDRLPALRRQLLALGCERVLTFMPLFWRDPEIFLPHFRVGLPSRLISHAGSMREAAELWADAASYEEYAANLHWLLGDPADCADPCPDDAYFAADLFSPEPSEIFADCGAFDGDTLKTFLPHAQNRFDRVVALEPDPRNFDKMMAYIRTLPLAIQQRIEALPIAVGAVSQRVPFTAEQGDGSRISDQGSTNVDCRTLDDIFPNAAPTYIKMDIEGAEPDALRAQAG